MKKIPSWKECMPSALSAALAGVSAVLLALAFPDFEIWRLALVAFVPLIFAVKRERRSLKAAFSTGWIFGTLFFFATCWWLTFAPITYAHLPWPPVYFLMFCAAAGAGIFPAMFAAALAGVWRRFPVSGLLAAPVLWVFCEFLRMWISGNNWNAAGYSLAFALPYPIALARIGGIYAVSFYVVAVNVLFCLLISYRDVLNLVRGDNRNGRPASYIVFGIAAVVLFASIVLMSFDLSGRVKGDDPVGGAYVVAVQPNVPMDGLTGEKYKALLKQHSDLAETKLRERSESKPTLVVFPESPMLFQYGDDAELREFFRQFAERNKTAVLFNSAESSPDGKQLMNSAVMINDSGAKVGQYDKIFLLPFGEFIPFPEPVASWMPAFVGNFKKGNEYDLLPVGDARAGVMICFESHFGALSGEYARTGADLLIEMTNDGYLGKTPILRQHLANSVFRAIETGRPVLRVTNVGITAFIDSGGNLVDPQGSYIEASSLWTVARSDSSLTPYALFGDWFAALCSIAGVALVIFCFATKPRVRPVPTESR